MQNRTPEANSIGAQQQQHQAASWHVPATAKRHRQSNTEIANVQSCCITGSSKFNHHVSPFEKAHSLTVLAVMHVALQGMLRHPPAY
jgi:hypothetical protein